MASQLSFDLPVSLPRSAYSYGERSSGETHGVVLTKRHIVDFILDISGYQAGVALSKSSLLEPSCGEGAFLLPAVERLLATIESDNRDVETLKDCFLAFDIDPGHVEATRGKVKKLLIKHGFSIVEADSLSSRWVVEGDFLLSNTGRTFDFIVGNPPYIRIEQLAPALQAEYRSRFSSLFDRADLYVAFIERGLDLISDTGRLTYICADRWILNKYGAPLRLKIADGFKVHSYVDLHDASPFDSDVIAYPAIFSIGRGKSSNVKVATLKTASEEECKQTAKSLLQTKKDTVESAVHIYHEWFAGNDPWVLSSPEHLSALRKLESRFAPIEADGHTKVGIGVATGKDELFIVGNDTGIEKTRLVPLVKREDIIEGRIKDAKRYVINTFEESGGTVSLNDYPQLRTYFRQHEELIKKRHVAKKNPNSWFRTIDRVYPELVREPKLLIPDIAGSNEVAFDQGSFHPHHNLYYITSDTWDLEVLGGLLSSKVALFFIWSYAVKMRGGYLRFQAQYLRRIRVPRPSDISISLKKEIRQSFRNRDFKALDALALQAYSITELPSFDFVDTRA
jgi:adenine-specific DNA-methyltransferase